MSLLFLQGIGSNKSHKYRGQKLSRKNQGRRNWKLLKACLQGLIPLYVKGPASIRQARLPGAGCGGVAVGRAALHCGGSAGLHGNDTLDSNASTPGILRLLQHMAPHIFHQGKNSALTSPLLCTNSQHVQTHTPSHLIHSHESDVSFCHRD